MFICEKSMEFVSSGSVKVSVSSPTFKSILKATSSGDVLSSIKVVAGVMVEMAKFPSVSTKLESFAMRKQLLMLVQTPGSSLIAFRSLDERVTVSRLE